MKVSVVTPSYNRAKFVRRCLDSVESQLGGFAIEHIILDNCSTDGTRQILLDYRDSARRAAVQLIIEPDAGQTDAINRGMKMATGDIVCWLNTDEFYTDDALSFVIDFIGKQPDGDVFFGDCDFADANGVIVKRKREYFFSKRMLKYYGCFIPSCATFVRRRAIDSGVLLSPEFKVAMDYDWYVRLADLGYRFIPMRRTLATFTWHDSNISTNLVRRRTLEVRLVRDRYSGASGPYWFRSFTYAALEGAWKGVRTGRRNWERYRWRRREA